MDRIAPRGSRYTLPYYQGPDGKLRQRQPTLESDPSVDPTTDPDEAERQLEALRTKMHAANAAQPQSRIVEYTPGAAKAFKTSRDLSDEELEGLDVFDPDNPPESAMRPSEDGVLYDSGWSAPKPRQGGSDFSGPPNLGNVPPGQWDRNPHQAPLAPGLRAKQQGYEESDLPGAGPPQEGDPNFRGPPRPGAGQLAGDENSPFSGMPTFKDKPDGEQYLTKEQKQAAKAPLYAYLQDKMARRQRATSGAAYDNIEKGIMGQRAQADTGALLGALSQGASMAGTLGGKRAESTIVPTMTKNLNDSTQGAFDNWRGMRGVEEVSNANDLNVAKYISGLDQFDEEKNLKKRELYLRALARRGGDTEWSRKFKERQQKEVERHNAAQDAKAKGIVPPNYVVVGESDNGIIMVNPRNPEETKTVPFPKGYKPRAAKGDPTPRWNEIGRDDKGNITYGNAADPSDTQVVQVDPSMKKRSDKEDKTEIDGKTRLKPGEMHWISDGRDAFNQMDDIDKLIPALGSLMGPVKGRTGGVNPYNEKAQNAQASLKVASQIIGKYMEGGVLRKEDEAKYEKMLPGLNDTLKTGKYKAAQIRKMLKDRYAGDLKALEAQGYSTKGYELPADPVDTTADGPADIPQSGLKDPEEMTDAERKEELEKLRKAAGG